ncbi:MAG: ATP-binding protein [Vicinamibacterales bacterium]
MRDSLRVRLVLLYAAVVTSIVALFGATVCYLFWNSLQRQIDREVQDRAQRVAHALAPFEDGSFDVNLPDDATAYFDPERFERAYYVIWASDGRRVDTSDPDLAGPRPAEAGTRTRSGWREAAVPGPRGSLVLVGRRLDDAYGELWSLGVTAGIVGFAAALLSIVGGWLLAGRVLAPIARINATARSMAAGALDARIPVEDTESELGQVAEALNSAFDRLRLAADQLRRFTTDASHELRTPVATLCAETEWALARERDIAAYQGSLRTCRTAALRIGRVVETLLTLARADAGQIDLTSERCRLDAVAADAVALVRPLADQRQVAITTDLRAVEMMGDRERLLEAISNVVVNGVLYNRPGGQVWVELGPRADAIELVVRDTGIGVAPEHLPRIFDRFYRVDAARTSGAGAGLGLSIAQWAIERHAGTIRCSSNLGVGTEFVIRFPADTGA